MTTVYSRSWQTIFSNALDIVRGVCIYLLCVYPPTNFIKIAFIKSDWDAHLSCRVQRRYDVFVLFVRAYRTRICNVIGKTRNALPFSGHFQNGRHEKSRRSFIYFIFIFIFFGGRGLKIWKMYVFMGSISILCFIHSFAFFCKSIENLIRYSLWCLRITLDAP